MLKKLGLGIAALLLASCLFVGCGSSNKGDDDVPGDLDWDEAELIWSLSEEILADEDFHGTITGNTQPLPLPLQSASSSTNPTFTISADGIKVSGRTSNWNAVDYVTEHEDYDDPELGLEDLKWDLSSYFYKVVVEGTGAEAFQIVPSDGEAGKTDGNLEGVEKDDFVRAFLTADSNEPRFRIRTNGVGDYTITEIKVYRLERTEFVAVEDITGIPSKIDPSAGSFELNGVVNPDDANFQDIVWTVEEDEDELIEEIDGNEVILADPSAEGEIKLKATIEKGKSATEDFVKVFTIKLEIPKLTIDLFGDEVVIEGTSIHVLNGEFDIVEGGYKVIWENGHGNHYVGFKVDLGANYVFDISSVEFDLDVINLEGEGSGAGKVMIRAQTAQQTGWTSDANVLATVVSAQGADINATGTAYDDEMEIAIDPNTKNSRLTGEVWFSIYIHTGSDSEIKVTNIKFNDGGSEPTNCATCGCDLSACSGCDNITGCDGDCETCDDCEPPEILFPSSWQDVLDFGIVKGGWGLDDDQLTATASGIEVLQTPDDSDGGAQIVTDLIRRLADPTHVDGDNGTVIRITVTGIPAGSHLEAKGWENVGYTETVTFMLNRNEEDAVLRIRPVPEEDVVFTITKIEVCDQIDVWAGDIDDDNTFTDILELAP